jgi:methylmalonyl-CoA/ethylmalonyl-CoA epimerase
MLDRISHVGVVVHDLEQACAFWSEVLGLREFARAEITVEGIRSVFLSVSGTPGEMTVELMQPIDAADMSNAVARRLARKGEGVYHLAVVVDDIPKSSARLQALGIPIIERAPVEGSGAGRWLVPPKAANGVMIEGIEEWSDTGLATGRLRPSDT